MKKGLKSASQSSPWTVSTSTVSYILVCLVAKASVSHYFHERKRNTFYFNPTMVTWKYTDMYLQKCFREYNIITLLKIKCFSVYQLLHLCFLDISLLSGKKRTWTVKSRFFEFLDGLIEKIMYILSQNIFFCTTLLSWQGVYIIMCFKVRIL